MPRLGLSFLFVIAVSAVAGVGCSTTSVTNPKGAVHVKGGDGFLQHLGLTHALYQRWESDRVLKTTPDRLLVERQKALDYVKKHKDSAFGWGMLCLLEDRAAEARAKSTDRPGTDAVFYRELADAFRLFADNPALGYAARYEEARCLLRSAQKDTAKEK